MSNRYQFGNVKNWSLAYETRLEAKTVPHPVLKQYHPIPDYTIPVLFFSPIIGVFVSSSDDPGYWNKAGFAKQEQRVDKDLAIAPDLIIRTQRLNLRKTTVCFFEKTKLETYVVKITAIPFWLRDLTLKVWEYIGNVENDDNLLLKEDIYRLEQKIDKML